MIPALSLSKVLAYHQLGMSENIPYAWGAKPDFALAPAEITGSDCSGWVRYLLYHGSKPDNRLVLPEGSEQIAEYLAQKGLRGVSYSNAALLADESRLFAAGFLPGHMGESAGHILLLRKGRTLECHGGQGVDSRLWNVRLSAGYSLASLVQWCREIPVE